MANELKTLSIQRVQLLAKLELAHAQHDEAVGVIERDMLTVLESIATCVAELDTKLPPKKRTKPKTKAPDHDATAKRYADFEPAESGCLCGCGEDVPEGTNFVKGHHPRLKSIAQAIGAGRLDISKISDGGRQYADAQGWLDGWVEAD